MLLLPTRHIIFDTPDQSLAQTVLINLCRVNPDRCWGFLQREVPVLSIHLMRGKTMKKWVKPDFCEKRCGFEVTLYLYNR